jgi:pimeloyl-ACP methyl ester carboxylesterase
VAELADSLGIDQFSVFGFSFGGPYARACAYALPDRVTRAGLVSCLGAIDDPAGRPAMPPPTRYGLVAARLSPLLALPMGWVTARQARSGKMIAQLSTSMGPSDAEILWRSEVADGLGKSSPSRSAKGSAPQRGTA